MPDTSVLELERRLREVEEMERLLQNQKREILRELARVKRKECAK